MNNVIQKVLNLAAATAITMAIGAPTQVSAADFTLKVTGGNSRTLPTTRTVKTHKRLSLLRIVLTRSVPRSAQMD